MDTWLDMQLRAVAVPPGMLERLRQVPVADDSALDAVIRDVPVPAALRPRLERIGRTRRRLARLRQMAMAASLMAAIGGSYLGGMLVFLWAAYPPAEVPLPRLISRVTLATSPPTGGRQSEVDRVRIVFLDEEPADGLPPAPEPPRPEFKLAADRRPLYFPLREMREQFLGVSSRSVGGPWEDRTLAGWPVFGAPDRREKLPELRSAPRLQRRGVAIPPVDGVDVAFLIQTGFNPFISPGAHPDLRTSTVPLSVDTRSYELTRESVYRGRRPPPDLLRTEDFLAAIDCQFPQPENQPLGLHVAGGPSPFAIGPWQHPSVERRLLQIGVQARDLPDANRPGTHLTVAVDVSASMGDGGRLEMVCRALSRPREWMGPKDRISLVTFGEEAYVLAENVGRNRADRLQAAVDSLVAQGSTHIVAGLRQAYSVGYHRLRDGRFANRVVLLTDSLAQLDPVTADRIRDRLAAPLASGISLHVIDVGDAGPEPSMTSGLAELARAGGGHVRRAANVEQVRSALRELVTGRRQLVAAAVRVKVAFNPRSVYAYRLLGHELADMPAAPEAEFQAGQSATALYEVLLRRNRETEVAVVELSWRDPATGLPGSATRKFRREQFAHYLDEAPWWLQAAAVVAEAAETLRGSPFVRPRPDPWSLAPVLEKAVGVDPRVREHPTFIEFLDLVERAEAARPHRSGGRG